MHILVSKEHFDRYMLFLGPRIVHWSIWWSGYGPASAKIFGWESLLSSWWRHQMETFSAILALCAGNSPFTGEFPAQRPVTHSFNVFLGLRLNKRLRKQSWGWWFEAPSSSLWHHCNVVRFKTIIQSICIDLHLYLIQMMYKQHPSTKVMDYFFTQKSTWCPRTNYTIFYIFFGGGGGVLETIHYRP